MTAIIVGILAALGIGGGFVIANNSGSSGGGAPAVVITGEKQDYTANVSPDYNLISAITDTAQYQPTVADSDTFVSQYEASALKKHLVATEEDYSIYGDPNDDLRNGLIRGEQISGTPYYATLNLLKGVGSFYIFSLKASSVSNGGWVQNDVQGILLTHADFKPLESVANRYDTFKIEDTPVYSPDNNIVFKHYNAVHLGGAALGLTVADFGHWEETAWKEQNSQKYLEMHNNKTFFFYDERFAYNNRYYKNTATMQGNVLVSTITDHQSVDNVYNLQTGSISMDLDLVSRRITNGQVVMDDANYAQYNVENFTGSINGSVFIIDGTGWQNVSPEVGQLRGGVGKLLIGANGLEMVGNFTKQIEYNGEVDDQGHPNYDPGKADYTFGAKEIN